MTVSAGVGREEYLFTVEGSVTSTAAMEIGVQVSQNLKRKVPHGIAGSLLDMYLKHSILYHCDTYSSMFIVAVVTVARE